MARANDRPAHLEPSELGTMEYWNTYYQNDLDQTQDDDDDEGQVQDPSELESWFDDVDAPARVLKYLTSANFPLSPLNGGADSSVLDLGTGNGSTLFSLRIEGGFTGPMVGVDYSQQSIDLARRLRAQYDRGVAQTDHKNTSPMATAAMSNHESMDGISFEQIDLIHGDPRNTPWWPKAQNGFDLVLDKGTFDAISLSSETVEDLGEAKRIHELYPRKIIDLIAPEGYLLVTSCNWTEDEVTRWFTYGEGAHGRLDVFDKIQYPVYEFGGQKGQGVASVCFKKRSTRIPEVPQGRTA